MADRRNSVSDTVTAWVGGVVFSIPLLAAAVAWWSDDATGFLRGHGILVDHPVLTVPGTGGAGLDWARLGIAFIVVATLSLAARMVASIVLTHLARRVVALQRDPQSRQ